MLYFDNKLTTILTEARLLRPARIIMKRGTIIDADHVRIISAPSGTTKIIVAGIGPGLYKEYKLGPMNPSWCGKGHHPLVQTIVSRMRDFFGIDEWVPCQYQQSLGVQDATGWATPRPNGRYDAHRDQIRKRLFKKILTMRPENIADIQWKQ